MSNPALLRILRSGALTEGHIGTTARREQPMGSLVANATWPAFSSMPASAQEHDTRRAQQGDGQDEEHQEEAAQGEEGHDGESSSDDGESQHRTTRATTWKARSTTTVPRSTTTARRRRRRAIGSRVRVYHFGKVKCDGTWLELRPGIRKRIKDTISRFSRCPPRSFWPPGA